VDKVSIEGLSFAFAGGAFHLDIERLSVGVGRILGIIGPNGAGKTTLLNIIALFERPAAGTVRILDRDITRGSCDTLALRREMSYMLSQPPLLSDTAFNNARLPLVLRGIRDMRIVDDMLALVGMETMKDRDVRTLSQGQRSRVALARALVSRPALLLLDEPFAHLDAQYKEGLIGVLGPMLRQSGTSVLFVTQNHDEALAFGDDLAVMMEGTIAQCAPPADVFNKPASPMVASFVGADTVLDGVIVHADGGLVEIAVGDRRIEAVAPHDVGDHVMVCIRPEAVTLDVPRAGDGVAASSARNHLRGIVTCIEEQRLECTVTLDCGFTLAATVTKQSVARLRLKPGSEVVAAFKATAAHVVRR